MALYKVVLAPSVVEALLDISSKQAAERISERLRALARFPLMGSVYDPIYESARPPHEVRVTFVPRHGIYYVFDEESREVRVEYLEDCRRNPLGKFEG